MDYEGHVKGNKRSVKRRASNVSLFDLHEHAHLTSITSLLWQAGKELPLVACYGVKLKHCGWHISVYWLGFRSKGFREVLERGNHEAGRGPRVVSWTVSIQRNIHEDRSLWAFLFSWDVEKCCTIWCCKNLAVCPREGRGEFGTLQEDDQNSNGDAGRGSENGQCWVFEWHAHDCDACAGSCLAGNSCGQPMWYVSLSIPQDIDVAYYGNWSWEWAHVSAFGRGQLMGRIFSDARSLWFRSTNNEVVNSRRIEVSWCFRQYDRQCVLHGNVDCAGVLPILCGR